MDRRSFALAALILTIAFPASATRLPCVGYDLENKEIIYFPSKNSKQVNNPLLCPNIKKLRKNYIVNQRSVQYQYTAPIGFIFIIKFKEMILY